MIKQVSVGEYVRNYSLVNNLWLFLGLGNDDVAPIIEGVIGEKYFVQSVYWQLLSPPPTPAASTSTDVLIHIQ